MNANSTVQKPTSDFFGATESSSSDSRIRNGLLLAILGTFLFALKSIWIKSAFSLGGNATVLLALRMAFSVPFYAAVLFYLRQTDQAHRLTRRDVLAACTLGFLGYYLASFLDMSGLELISAQLERLTLFTYPTLISVLAWLFLKERFGYRTVLSLLLSYFGVFLMYVQERILADSANLAWGILLVVLSALSYSTYVILAKPMIQRMGSREFTSCAMLGSAGFAIVHCAVAEPISDSIRLVSTLWGYGLLLAFVCTVIPSFLINEAIVRIGASRTSIIGSIGPVVTMLLAIFILKEPTSVWHFAGMLTVIAGVSLVARR